MKTKRQTRILLFISLWIVPALACALFSPAPPEPTAVPPVEPVAEVAATPESVVEAATPTMPPEPTEEPAPETNAVTSLQDVRRATIQIEAQGSFIDPEVGALVNVAGRGSGFIIDPSGIAVTNNHVVTGAAVLRVFVAGEDRARNARVLGASECADLAVIKIEGDDFPYLEWHDGPINVGLDVYAAGFPLGDPEYTLTRGVVSKERALAVTEYFGVDGTIEHDARINPGNSGGPLVSSDGRIVAVNFATSSRFNQHFAIVRDHAIPLIQQMEAGQDVYSIGINGSAVTDGQSISGVWVSSVKSGSPADRAGVQPGDIIVRMEGLVLATDGTVADYCSILRSRSAEDTLAVEVLRFATEEYLEGQINGRTLELKFSFARELEQAVGGSSSSSSSAPAAGYRDYVLVSDDTGAMVMEIPVEWRDVDGSVWQFDGEVLGASLTAAADINRFETTWSEPGVQFAASHVLMAEFDEVSLLDEIDWSDECRFSGRFDYSDAAYTGLYDVWSECGGTDTILLTLAATPGDGAFLIYILVQIVSDADLEALDRIFNSFLVIDALPPQSAAPAAPPAGAGNVTTALLQAMRSVRTDLERAGGLVDHAINAGSIDCQDVVNTYDRVARAPTFNVSGASSNAYNAYRDAVSIFTNGARDMAQNCRDYLINPSGGSIPFQQWGLARQSVNNALDRLNPAIQSLGG
jgi:serine protease Do